MIFARSQQRPGASFYDPEENIQAPVFTTASQIEVSKKRFKSAESRYDTT